MSRHFAWLASKDRDSESWPLCVVEFARWLDQVDQERGLDGAGIYRGADKLGAMLDGAIGALKMRRLQLTDTDRTWVFETVRTWESHWRKLVALRESYSQSVFGGGR